jgi:hypothetical protein
MLNLFSLIVVFIWGILLRSILLDKKYGCLNNNIIDLLLFSYILLHILDFERRGRVFTTPASY